MKHIIVEGADRCGKSSLIKFICSKAENYTVRHFGKPTHSTNEEKIQFQKDDFLNEFILSLSFHKESFKHTDNDLLIWDRGHIGELPYGKMYRCYDPTWIWEYEKTFSFDKKNIYLIFLYADPKFLMKQEDGHSISDKLENREYELKLFQEAFDLSIIKNKLSICVNDGDSYISIEEIQNKVANFLNL